jgi:hypothetical protein
VRLVRIKSRSMVALKAYPGTVTWVVILMAVIRNVTKE